MENLFSNLTNDELKAINKDRLEKKKEGLRPRSFDDFILIAKSQFHFTFSEGLSYVEKDFYEEVCKRFFEEKS